MEAEKKPNLAYREKLKDTAIKAGVIGVGLIGASQFVNAGLLLKSDGVEHSVNEISIKTLCLTVDGGGTTITTGVKGYLRVPYNGTIKSTSVIADQTGSVVIDVWKANGSVPTVSNTITASAKPTLSSAQTSFDSTLTGWTKTIVEGDIVGFNVDSATTVTRVTLVIEVEC